MIIDNFSGNFSFLSNFYPASFEIDGVKWPTAEHYYQAMKTTSKVEQDMIRKLDYPGKAKKAGQKVDLRPDWDEVKDEVMLTCLKAKFEQNKYIRTQLINTRHHVLIEGNSWYDTYWGVDSELGGQNKLGKILMQLREEYIKDFDSFGD